MVAKIKVADIGEVGELNNISGESKMYWNYPQEWLEMWKDDLELTEKDFLDQKIFKVEVEPGLTVGFCSLKENENEVEIMHFWIKPGYIGKGLGKYLFKESIRYFNIKEKPIIVEADPNAENFYSRLGFKTFAKRKSYFEGRFLPLMKKEYQPDE
jgi:ribosomal protein S18 acetylase RimI-like enzyme